MLQTEAPALTRREDDFFERFYLRRREELYEAARTYVKDAQDCEDVVQEALFRLLRKQDTLRRMNELSLTLYAVATVKNTALNHNRAQENRLRYIETAGLLGALRETPDPSPTAEAGLLAAAEAAELSDALARLKPRERAVLEGRYLRGMDDEALGRMLGVDPRSVRMCLTRARRNAYEKLRYVR